MSKPKALNEIQYEKSPLKNFSNKSKSQEQFWNHLHKPNNELILASGGAGTGKTFTALAYCLMQLHKQNYKQLILTKPLVATEEVGILPGTTEEKISPYNQSFEYIILELIGKLPYEQLKKESRIRYFPMAFMRGITFTESLVILDEAQNTTTEQLKLVFSRLGKNSKMIVIGDIDQIDLRKKASSGLGDAMKRLNNLDGVSLFRFDDSENVRNPLVYQILERYKDVNI